MTRRAFSFFRTRAPFRLSAALIVAAGAISAGTLASCTASSASHANALTAPDATVAASSASTDTPTLKIGAPTPVSPVRNQVVTISPTFSATPVTGTYATFTPQYRIRVFDASGVIALDSGLLTTPTWTPTLVLTPNASFTWMARAEYLGATGPWSVAASFATTNPPQPGPPIGDWQDCAPLAGVNNFNLSACVWNAVHPVDSESDMEMVKRVAWLLRGQGGGLLIKTSGDGVIFWQGFNFSASRVCFPDGHIFKVLTDAGPGGANQPDYSDNDFVDPSLYVPAMDPSLPR